MKRLSGGCPFWVKLASLGAFCALAGFVLVWLGERYGPWLVLPLELLFLVVVCIVFGRWFYGADVPTLKRGEPVPPDPVGPETQPTRGRTIKEILAELEQRWLGTQEQEHEQLAELRAAVRSALEWRARLQGYGDAYDGWENYRKAFYGCKAAFARLRELVPREGD